MPLTLSLLLIAGSMVLQNSQQEQTGGRAAIANDAGAPAGTASVSCASESGGRTHCAAATAGGVALLRSTGTAPCLLGKTWGYDEAGVWVLDGCSGEFVLGGQAPAPAGPPQERDPTPRNDIWGEFDPGRGFLVGRTDVGELALSAYALVRYMNQTPGDGTFTDHLGREQPVDGRQDIFPHRVLVWFKGWVGVPKLVYTITLWTVNATDQNAIFGNIGYQFSPRFNLYAGINGNPGTRSLQGSHPFWLGHDRVMADEFFRPFFASGVYAQGEASPGLWYNVMLGNSNSALGIRATQLDRRFAAGGSVWWMPTTKEFGPRGAFGDWERHERLATRFGISTFQSQEQRFTDADDGSSGNTTLRLADSLNVFDTGSLAQGVTVQQVDYRIVSFDAGMKYKGLFLQTEAYLRWLDDFVADGPLPVTSIFDRGFYVQGSFYPIPRRLEVYGVTSQIFGDGDAGFDHSDEYGGGFNFYPADTRNHRFNFQVVRVDGSPVSSTFGYYVGGQDGTTLSVAFSVFF